MLSGLIKSTRHPSRASGSLSWMFYLNLQSTQHDGPYAHCLARRSVVLGTLEVQALHIGEPPGPRAMDCEGASKSGKGIGPGELQAAKLVLGLCWASARNLV